MSAGTFARALYEAQYGGATIYLHPIRVQPETLAAAIGSETNAAPTTGTQVPISAITSRNRRQRGLIPRTIRLQAPATGQPAGYKPLGVTSIPALTTDFYDAAIAGASCSYLGVAWTVIGKSPEIVN
jgi:hypothetical protein